MAEAEPNFKNFKNIPITAMSHQTKSQLSSLLNLRKVLCTEKGYHSDWRGISHLINEKNLFDHSAISGSDPTSKVLELWQKYYPKTANFENLQNYLKEIDRWDVLDDISELLVKDAKNYKVDETNLVVTTEHTGEPTGSELDVLTKDDVELFKKNLPPQIYDGFLLCSDNDNSYAASLKSQLENDSNLKICTKDNVLDHKALIQVIHQRCKRLIVLLTKEFQKSSENKFLLHYKLGEEIHNNNGKLLLIICDDDVRIPVELKYGVHLKKNTPNFLEILKLSINFASSH